MLYNPENKLRGTFDRYDEKWKFRIDDVHEYGFSVEMKNSLNSRTVWCYLTPEGKIKYDILRIHPVTIACNFIGFLTSFGESQRVSHYKKYLDGIKQTDVPTFGFTMESDVRSSKESLRNTIEWLEENGATYDNSEPHIFLCPKAFKSEKKRLKTARQRL